VQESEEFRLFLLPSTHARNGSGDGGGDALSPTAATQPPSPPVLSPANSSSGASTQSQSVPAQMPGAAQTMVNEQGLPIPARPAESQQPPPPLPQRSLHYSMLSQSVMDAQSSVLQQPPSRGDGFSSHRCRRV
jgi:hypothetical protein